MRITVYLLLLAPALLSAVGPSLARHLAPAAATRALTALASAAGIATAWGLGILAVGGLGRTGEVQAYARTDPAVLAATDPVPRTLGVLAAALLGFGIMRLGRLARRRRRAVRALAGLRALPAADDLLVVDDDAPDAYALPGRPRRIVVTAAMLRALPPDEQRVLLAHERSHLHRRHHRYTATAEAAAALNPLLGRLRDQVAFVVERWADEDAAHTVADRPLAARSLARAALATAAYRRGPRVALAFVRHQVTARVGALRAARPTSRWSAAWPAAMVVLLTGLVLADANAAFLRLLAALHP